MNSPSQGAAALETRELTSGERKEKRATMTNGSRVLKEPREVKTCRNSLPGLALWRARKFVFVAFLSLHIMPSTIFPNWCACVRACVCAPTFRVYHIFVLELLAFSFLLKLCLLVCLGARKMIRKEEPQLLLRDAARAANASENNRNPR